jgi:putative N6-adenine-specific DNA methylase
VEILVKTMFGLEDILIEELESLGISNCKKLKRAVKAEATLKQLYEANLKIRTGLQILVPMYTFRARNEQEVYDNIYKHEWTNEFRLRDTFAIEAHVNSRFFNHSKYIALKTKDAIADKFTDTFERRPNVDPKDPDFAVNLYIQDDQVTVYKNSSGKSLHKRGYRLKAGKAPLNEVLAAGLLLIAKYDGNQNFIDPMCGSGTLLAEASMIATNTPANFHRKKFAFQSWDDYDKKLFNELKSEAEASIIEPKCAIWGCDISTEALDVSFENLSRQNYKRFVKLKKRNFLHQEPAVKEALVVFNPPYDLRIGSRDINELYREMGDTLKQYYGGSTAWMISSNMQAFKHVGLRPSRKVPLFNGPLECKFQKYELYAGSKKAKYQ